MRPVWLLLLGFAACAPAGPDGGSSAPGGGPPGGIGAACGALERGALIGTPVAAAGLTEGRLLRIVGPDDVVTMDFVPARLNVDVDADGTIVGLRCG